MQWLETIYFFILVTYVVFILYNFSVFAGRKKQNADLENYTPKTTVTIIVPAHNEEQTISTCLQDIAAQKFPKDLLQVIVVNDHSTDNTSAIVQDFIKDIPDFFLLHTAEKGKKAAIIKAVQQATGKVIVTRDADTVVNNSFWLKSIIYNFETTGCHLLISPVILTPGNSFISTFQQLENLAITSLGLGMAKRQVPFVCSGANLAYKKEIFVELDPYKNNLQTASGDDMFLLKYFYRSRKKITANTQAAGPVYTPAENSFKSMLYQRLRWASKTGKINTLPVFSIGLLVLLTNTLCIPALCLGFVNGGYLSFSLLTLILKFIIDFLLLFLSARMFKQKVNWLWFLPAFLFNGLYVPAVTLASVFARPGWKSRSF
jgi:biofilm PGA synthesis N-glycosyltransferase PgaC